MTRFIILTASMTALILSACSGQADTDEANINNSVPIAVGPQEDMTASNAVEMDGEVRLSVDRLISEDAACLMMMRVENGMDADVSAGLFAFNVTGNDETSGANMFPQTAPSGGDVTAQIILPGADCDNALMIEGGQLACTVADTGESCTDVLVLSDEAVEFADPESETAE